MPVHRPRVKLLRRFGIALPGLSRKDHERRPTPPGQHGQTPRRRKVSEYARLLLEKQKVRFNYGISETQLRRYVERARRMPGRTGENVLALIERRLDNVVFRLGFAPTIPAARQLVSHGKVMVNGRRVDRASFEVSIGDGIAIKPGKSRENVGILAQVEKGPEVRLPSYLAIDPSDKFTGRMIAPPTRTDIPLQVQEGAIVEYYAR